MIDYSIEKYVINNHRTIQYDDLVNFDRVKKVIIISDFDISIDCANHFAGMKSLEQFEVVDNRSRFYTENGVLYANITKNPKDKLRSKDMFDNIWDDFSGKILVAFPTNYPQKAYAIPEGTVAICKGAFESTNIEELSLPTTLEFIDFHALEATHNLRVLRVPNKKIEIYDHFEIGKEEDFSIVSSCGSPLSESIIEKWHAVTAPFPNEPKDENLLGAKFQGNVVYSRNIVWPSEEGHTEILTVLSNKDKILSYYLKHKNLDNVSDENRLLLALFLYLIDSCKLHPANETEANTVIDMVFGAQGVDDDWLKRQAGSPRDYKQLCRLLSNDRIRFLDFISVTTIHGLLTNRAKNILTPLVENNNIFALSNLLYILNATFLHDAPNLMIKAAKLGDPVSMWMTALEAYRQGEENLDVAINLWKKLSQGEVILPHIHLEDIIWDARNNLKWIEQEAGRHVH